MQSPRSLAPPLRSDTGQPIANPRPARAPLFIAFALAVLLALTFPQPAAAAPGDPDLTFHGQGWTLVPVSGSGFRFAVQEDGRMVAAGSSGDGLVVHRLLADGAPDLSFHGTGNVTTGAVAGHFLDIPVIALQPDGKLLVAGLATSAPTFGFQIVLLRYLPDGALDPAFGEGSGFVSTPTPFNLGIAPGSLAVESNGGILLSMFITVWRFEPSGALDLSFAQPASGGTVKVLSDGKILVCQGSGNPLAVQRLLPGGNLDSTFGVNGTALVTVPPGFIEQELQIEVLPDGRIWIGGQLRRGGIPSQPPIVTDLLLMRLLPNGSPDTGFNGSGVAVFDNGSSSKFCGIMPQPDGGLILAGQANRQLILTYLRYGTLDPRFGAAGRVVSDFAGFNDDYFGAGIAPGAERRILLAGIRSASGGGGLLLRRYINLLDIHPTMTLEVSAPSIDGSPRVLLMAKDLNPDAAAVVQTSTNLSQWSPLFESPPAAERTALALDLPALAARRFFRLVQ